jgi:hypothetical protein
VKIDARTLRGLASFSLSVKVRSSADLPLAVERTMRWGPGEYGMHTARAMEETDHPWYGHPWYFADGAQGFFDTYLLFSEFLNEPTYVNLEFLFDDGPPLLRSYWLTPNMRTTLYLGGIPELVGRTFGIVVSRQAERSMYFGQPLFAGGHASSASPVLSTHWLFAEGATGAYFTTFLLLANPGDVPAEVLVTYLPSDGPPVVRARTVPAKRRLTINVADEAAVLAATTFATDIRSSAPIVAERSQFWPGAPAGWVESHGAMGAPAPWTRWGLADGRVGGAANYQTYILLANFGAAPATATLTFLREDGAPLVRRFRVAPRSRFTVSIGGSASLVPELANEEFATLVTADQPIVVERALYASANGIVWAAGSCEAGTPLPQ